MAYETGNAPQFQNALNVPQFQWHNAAQDLANVQNTQANTQLQQAQIPNALAQAQSTMADVPLKGAQANAQNALPGLYAAQGQNQTAQAGLTNTQNKLSQLQAVQNLTGSVMMADPSAQPAAYSQAIKMAQASGIDTSAFPDTWGPRAQASVQAAYYSSGQNLERLKAYGQLAIQSQQSQMQAAQMIQMMQMNGIQPSPQLAQLASGGQTNAFFNQAMPNMGQSQGQGAAPPGMAMQGQGGPGQSPGASSLAAYQQGNQPGGGVAVMQQPGQDSSGVGSTVPPVSRIAGATKQAQDWVTVQTNAAKAAEIARQTQPAIDAARANAQNGIIPTSPVPGVAQIRERTTEGENLDAASAQAQAGLTSLARLQQGRVPPALLDAYKEMVPNNSTTPAANQNRINTMDAYNKFTAFQADAYKQLSSLGVTDPTVAQSIMNKTWDGLNAVDSKTGKIDPSKVTPTNLYSSLNKAVNGQDETKGATLMYNSPVTKGLVSQDDLEATAAARHVPLDTVIKDFKASPSNFNPGS